MKRRKFLRNVAIGSVGLASLPAVARPEPQRPDPAEVGQWDVLPENSQVLAVHAALLHSAPGGQILYFGGDEHDKGRHNRGLIDHTRLFDCATHEIMPLSSPTTDVFCSGHAFLGDGRLLVAGGTEAFKSDDLTDFHHGHFPGIPSTWIFDPVRRDWSRAADMSGGRWYPTLVTLPGGQVLALSGHPSKSDHRGHLNSTLELFDPASAPGWIDQGRAADAPADIYQSTPYPMYPRVHILPDGRLFCASPMPHPDGPCWAWDPSSKHWSAVAPSPGVEYSLWPTPTGLESNTQKAMTSVLLPLLAEEEYRARVLIFGATQPKVIEPCAPDPVWTATSPRTLRSGAANQPPVRHHAGCVLLPDGSALVLGGSQDNLDRDCVRAAELYDPGSGRWSTGAAAAVPRQYHSVALLMPDGRVWTAGSNRDGKQSFRDTLTASDADQPGIDNRELRIEIYSPPYLFRGPRPVIEVAPDTLALPGTFEIGTPDSADIQRVALLRCGSSTHAFDSDQRHVGLAIRSRTDTALTLEAPPDSNIAPPGYYMLFMLSSSGVPSTGRFIRVT